MKYYNYSNIGNCLFSYTTISLEACPAVKAAHFLVIRLPAALQVHSLDWVVTGIARYLRARPQRLVRARVQVVWGVRAVEYGRLPIR